MTLPVELITALGSGIMALLSLIVHLQIRQSNQLNKMHLEQAVYQTSATGEATALKAENAAIRRHLERKEQETAALTSWMQRQKQVT